MSLLSSTPPAVTRFSNGSESGPFPTMVFSFRCAAPFQSDSNRRKPVRNLLTSHSIHSKLCPQIHSKLPINAVSKQHGARPSVVTMTRSARCLLCRDALSSLLGLHWRLGCLRCSHGDNLARTMRMHHRPRSRSNGLTKLLLHLEMPDGWSVAQKLPRFGDERRNGSESCLLYFGRYRTNDSPVDRAFGRTEPQPFRKPLFKRAVSQ